MAARKPADTTSRKKPGPKPREVPLVVTSVRLEADQWTWLRRRALERALEAENPGRADASLVLRELVAQAMKRGR